ncbi:GntR family transcriptional regulator [Saccharopolyspora sp. ASAGF58]|uniref:GntR family transcriptional regulator n=1 Tax=Saccharopolyspora sp. ASAGF58 TaxID=2719023 RepID=UPI001FF0DEE4|nr:GntR family transcriptional regulator [Saccharopolyspora sp. ASAGF58]
MSETTPEQPGRDLEPPLAARLGVSRGPIREALRILAEEGMLERLPNRGAAVPDVSATNILDLYAVRASLGALVIARSNPRFQGEAGRDLGW